MVVISGLARLSDYSICWEGTLRTLCLYLVCNRRVWLFSRQSKLFLGSREGDFGIIFGFYRSFLPAKFYSVQLRISEREGVLPAFPFPIIQIRTFARFAHAG